MGVYSKPYRFILSVFFVSVFFVLAFLYGIYSFRYLLPPVNYVLKIENKIKKILGSPDEILGQVEIIESTFLQLKGSVYSLPFNDYISGGGLVKWGDSIVVVDHAGDFYLFDENNGIRKLNIVPPYNGLSDYLLLSKTSKWKGHVHKPDKIRFNDAEYIETELFRGVAVSYTYFDKAKECYGNRVSLLRLAESSKAASDVANQSGDWEVIYETTPCLPLNNSWTVIDGIMAGGRMAYDGLKTIYVGVGDFHLDGMHTTDVGVQNDEVSYGKVVAIDLISRNSRIVSKGHRNIQGVTLDKMGRLWVTEHGVRGGDELNLIKEGGNYGWPLASLGTYYSGLPLPTKSGYGRHEGYIQPVFAWLPSSAISSLTTIHGIDESWDGDLLAGSLSSKEFGQSLFHIRIDGDRVVFVERIKVGVRVRDVIQFGKNKIALWDDRKNLIVFELSRRVDALGLVKDRLNAKYGEETTKSVVQILNGCAECHSFDQYDDSKAPSLNGVFNRSVASTDFNGYSDALLSKGGDWSESNLKSFLKDPQREAPGTIMPPIGVEDDELIDAVVWALKNVDSDENPDMKYD